MQVATREVEQALCTVTLGPRRSSLYAASEVRKLLSFRMRIWSGPAVWIRSGWESRLRIR